MAAADAVDNRWHRRTNFMKNDSRAHHFKISFLCSKILLRFALFYKKTFYADLTRSKA